jgi:hypothetical protein
MGGMIHLWEKEGGKGIWKLTCTTGGIILALMEAEVGIDEEVLRVKGGGGIGTGGFAFARG